MTRRHYRRTAHRRAHGHPHGYGHGYGHGHGVGGGMAVQHAYRSDRRRERRTRRRHRRGVRGALVFAGALLLGVVIAIGLVVRVLIGLVEVAFPLVLVALVAMVLFWGLHRTRRDPQAPAAEETPPITDAPRVVWQRAKDDFDRVRTEYAAFECDPMAVLRTPALADVSVASTARFVDAFAEAQALDTDDHPGDPHDTRYVAAVDRARRAWQAARDAADRIRLSGLAPAERTSVERVLKLLTTARDSDSEPERLAAYGRARTELDRLERAGVVHLPRTARAAIDDASRGALGSGDADGTGRATR